jgi:hypothetical protein
MDKKIIKQAAFKQVQKISSCKKFIRLWCIVYAI